MHPHHLVGPWQFWSASSALNPKVNVSLFPLKDLTDSDPEPSTVERLGAGPGSGFKWESSVGEPLPTACLALLFPKLT